MGFVLLAAFSKSFAHVYEKATETDVNYISKIDFSTKRQSNINMEVYAEGYFLALIEGSRRADS